MVPVVVEAAVAALAAARHAAALVAECHAAASLVAAWARAARVGTALIRTVPPEIGMAITAMAETGMATTGTATIGTAGVAMMSSSSGASASHGGGALAVVGAGTTATHTTATAIILMAMVVPTATAMVMVGAATVMATITLTGVISMVMATGKIMVMDTATLADPEFPSYNGDCHELAIIMDPSTESWDHKRGAQSGRTSKTTIPQVSRASFRSSRWEVAIIFSVDWPAVS